MKRTPKTITLVAMLCSSEVAMSQACWAGTFAASVLASVSTTSPLAAARSAIAARPAAIRPRPYPSTTTQRRPLASQTAIANSTSVPIENSQASPSTIRVIVLALWSCLASAT